MWPDPDPDATYLVTRCTELRRKPLADFTAEDLRIMLGQAIGVPSLLPLAVGVLRDDPLVEADYHPGDLLLQVLRLPDSAWSGLAAEREQLRAVVADLVAGPALSDPDLSAREAERLRPAIEQFLG
ncbi:hypothetical protein KBX63_20260 [Micromonospora sp. U21]|nr:hypothetical protein [Micromonospora sp. U21]